jgi:hypothetical protein
MRGLLPVLMTILYAFPAASAQGGPDVLSPPPPPSAPAGAALPARQQPPTPDDQKKAEKTIRDLFKEDYAKRAPEERQDLARKLLANALGTKDDPAGVFVLLREAADIAASSGDVRTAMSAIDESAARFAVDASKLKVEALERARGSVRTPEAAKALVEAGLLSAESAADAEDYDAALSLLAKAEPAARLSRDAALLARIQDRARELRDAQSERRRIQAFLARLEADPDDPEANLAVGLHRCFAKDDWEKGLPMLAKGSDRALKALAEKERTPPETTDGQVALGDGWWEAASGKGKTDKARYQERAVHWYGKALPRLVGIAKVRVEKKIEEARAAAGSPGTVSAARAAELVRRLPAMTERDWTGLPALAEVIVHADFRKNADPGIVLEAGGRYLLLPCPTDRWNTSSARWKDVDYRGHLDVSEKATNGMAYLRLCCALNGGRLVPVPDELVVQGPGKLQLEPSDREGGGSADNNQGSVRVKVLRIRSG